MLPKHHRLHAGTRLVNAASIQTPLFVVKWVRNNTAVSRFGFVVSKRVDARAVVRNRVRRIVRSCVEEHVQDIPQGYDMLFIVKKNEENRTALVASVLHALRSIQK